jgi:hypothetical protein
MVLAWTEAFRAAPAGLTDPLIRAAPQHRVLLIYNKV